MRLQGAVFDSVSEKDIRDVMGKVKEKALAGDLGAAKFLLDYVASPKVNYTRRDTTITHKDDRTRGDIIDARTIDDDGLPANDALSMYMRRQAAQKLTAGAAHLYRLADELKVPEDAIASVLTAPWFTRNGNNEIHLTTVGRKELLS